MTLARLPAWRTDGSLTVVVESPRGSGVKFKFEPETGAMTVSRPLPFGLVYPYDWGFIPSTQAPDGDPLDAFVVWEGTSYPGVVLRCRPIGVLEVEQASRETGGRERNDRLAVVPLAAHRQADVQSVLDLSERVRAELEQFFVNAVAFEKKELVVIGWGGPDDARALLEQASSATGSRGST